MSKPIGVQLYSVREALAVDYVGTLRRLADMGIAGVEFAGMYGTSVADTARLLSDMGLRASSMHQMLPLTQEAFDTAAAFGVDTVVCPWFPPERFTTLDSLKVVCDELNEGARAAKAAGLRFAYHNHDFEFRPLPDGSQPYDHMLKWLSPDVLFELDIYWVRHGGQDPVTILNQLGERAVLIHTKDGTGVAGDAFVALGEGIVDIPAALRAAGDTPDWLIVELDSCATDMFYAIDKSVRYLKDHGFGHGR
jgi:sugar phosphate isomerase/epimerase